MSRYDGEPLDSISREPAYSQRELRDRTQAKHVKRGPLDLPFLLLTLLILTIGVVMVLSASFARAYYTDSIGNNPTYYFGRQLLFAVSGSALMIAASRFSVSFYKRIAMPLLIVSVFMLLLVPIIGVSENGAKRWISLGFTTFQPSEIAKLAVILSFAAMICVYKDKMKTFKYGVLPFAIVLVVIVGLLILEPHLSASVIIIAIGAIMMFAGGTKWQYFAVGFVAVALVGVLLITQMGYASDRVTSWLDPFSDPQGDGFQTIQSLYAIGSGGLLGLGLGQGRQKYLYLPEEHNDFIFSVVCEELGFIGALLILLLFALLIIRGYWLALHARDRFGALVITGITSLLAIQVFLNVAVVTNLVPCTGISLPFFSYGGTALWIQLIEMGIVLSISRDIPLRRSDKREEKK
ncbi:MAG: putative lipid II flippase FtsW [Oscillospiraceae bacterium]